MTPVDVVYADASFVTLPDISPLVRLPSGPVPLDAFSWESGYGCGLCGCDVPPEWPAVYPQIWMHRAVRGELRVPLCEGCALRVAVEASRQNLLVIRPWDKKSAGGW